MPAIAFKIKLVAAFGWEKEPALRTQVWKGDIGTQYIHRFYNIG